MASNRNGHRAYSAFRQSPDEQFNYKRFRERTREQGSFQIIFSQGCSQGENVREYLLEGEDKPLQYPICTPLPPIWGLSQLAVRFKLVLICAEQPLVVASFQ